MSKRFIITFSLFITLIFVVLLFLKYPFIEKGLSEFVKKEEYSFKIIQIDKDKWAYSIFLYDKPFIKQTHIPAISGNKYFKTERDAEITAKLVMSKLNKGEIPSVTGNELRSIGVIP
jgi:hypothetical protein